MNRVMQYYLLSWYSNRYNTVHVTPTAIRTLRDKKSHALNLCESLNIGAPETDLSIKYQMILKGKTESSYKPIAGFTS